MKIKNCHIKVLRRQSLGFTLIEVLAVIAIIGIISSVVLAALGTARSKARDAQRILQLKEIRTALNLYGDTHLTYPSTTPAGFSGNDAAIKYITSATDGTAELRIAPVPINGGGATYIYRGIQADGSECLLTGEICSGYALGIELERADNIALSGDVDRSLGTVFYGSSGDCLNNSGAERCFDLQQ
jgi:prepilin-type N-terminal cleavage/methylation domain-containing protein